MTKTESEKLKEILSDTPVLKAQVERLKTQKKAINQTKRRIETILKKYLFLHNLIRPLDTSNNDETTRLEKDVAYFFKKLEIGEVKWLGKGSHEDVLIIREESIIMIEVTSIDNTQKSKSLKADKAYQIIPNKVYRKEDFPNKKIYGLVVVNFIGSQPIKTSKNPFDNNILEKSKKNGDTICTTRQLVDAYVSICNGTNSKDEFIEAIERGGYFEIRSAT